MEGREMTRWEGQSYERKHMIRNKTQERGEQGRNKTIDRMTTKKEAKRRDRVRDGRFEIERKTGAMEKTEEIASIVEAGTNKT